MIRCYDCLHRNPQNFQKQTIKTKNCLAKTLDTTYFKNNFLICQHINQSLEGERARVNQYSPGRFVTSHRDVRGLIVLEPG